MLSGTEKEMGMGMGENNDAEGLREMREWRVCVTGTGYVSRGALP